MKRTYHVVLMTLFWIVGLLSAPALASVVINTGSSMEESGSSYFFDSNGNYPAFAAKFTITQPLTITDILGALQYDYSGTANLVSAAIYTGAALPGSVYNSYSSTFSLPTVPSESGRGPAGWYGLTGLTWYLPAGTYWSVIQGIGSTSSNHTTFWVYNQSASPPGPLPSGNALYTQVYAWEDMSGVPSYEFAWQVNATPVPIPGAVWLLGSGLIGLIGIRRFRQ